jgi:hypothetical protein
MAKDAKKPAYESRKIKNKLSPANKNISQFRHSE